MPTALHGRDIPVAVLTAMLATMASCGGHSTTNTPTGPTSTPQTHTNVLTYHNDTLRTGQNTTETTLTPANVNSASFGKLFSVSMDGKVDAQPLYVSQLTIAGQGIRSVVYAATEHDTVYAFDARNGTIYWHTSLLGAGETPSDDRSCGQVVPEIGITATPVIDLTAGSQGAIYVLAMSLDAAGGYHHRLHALDITTGQEESGAPVEIAATFAGSGDNSSNGQVVFDPKQYKSRSGLLLLMD
jgi:outer membrane protein assembly factor BamB